MTIPITMMKCPYCGKRIESMEYAILEKTNYGRSSNFIDFDDENDSNPLLSLHKYNVACCAACYKRIKLFDSITFYGVMLSLIMGGLLFISSLLFTSPDLYLVSILGLPFAFVFGLIRLLGPIIMSRIFRKKYEVSQGEAYINNAILKTKIIRQEFIEVYKKNYWFK